MRMINETRKKNGDSVLELGKWGFAAQYITSLTLIDENRTFFDQRKEIADKLNTWYKEYKKSDGQKKE